MVSKHTHESLTTQTLLSFVFTVPTWLQWVLYVEHGGPVAIHHVLLNLVFGNVATSIFYPDACFQVVEVATVQLKEFNEQNTDVDVGTAHILPEVKLENTQYEWMSELQTVKGVGIHSLSLTSRCRDFWMLRQHNSLNIVYAEYCV